MKSVILAAGEGTRLRPHTRDRPKCLVELVGTSLLEHQIETLHKAGITDISVVTGYREDQVTKLGCPTFHNPDYRRTNMVASLVKAKEVLEAGDDVLISYADIVYEPTVVTALLTCEAPVAMAVNRRWRQLWDVRMDDPLLDAETLKLDSRGHVIELGKKPDSYADIEGQYMGLIKFRGSEACDIPSIYAELAPDALYDGKDLANMYMTSFLQHWIDHRGPIQAVMVNGGWLEVDTTDDLELYTSLHRQGTLDRFCRL